MPEPKKPEREFAAAPGRPVVWRIVDAHDSSNVRYAVSHVAYEAFERSGIARNGQRLSYGDVEVAYSEAKTEEWTRSALLDLLVALGKPRARKRRRSR